MWHHWKPKLELHGPPLIECIHVNRFTVIMVFLSTYWTCVANAYFCQVSTIQVEYLWLKNRTIFPGKILHLNTQATLKSPTTNILSYTAHCLVESRSLGVTALCLQLDGTKCIPMKAEMFLDLHHKNAIQGELSLKSMIQAWGEPFQTNGINLLQAIRAHCWLLLSSVDSS